MLNTISLSGHLLARAKRQSAHGMPRSAARTLGTLTSFGNLDPVTAGESHAIFAELELRNRRFRAARRNAKAALAASPSCPQYQYICGRAWENGVGADLQKAANWYLSCLEGQPNHLQARCALGLLRVSTGLVNEGIAILSEAWRSHPDSYEVFLALFSAYRRSGQSNLARTHLVEARFRLKSNPRFRALLCQIKYKTAAKRQNQAGKGNSVVLPFLRVADPVAPPIGERLPSTTIRIDGPGTVQEPHAFRIRRHQRGRNA
jgi:tetratricopeptide (TPR) repeat protein